MEEKLCEDCIFICLRTCECCNPDSIHFLSRVDIYDNCECWEKRHRSGISISKYQKEDIK